VSYEKNEKRNAYRPQGALSQTKERDTGMSRPAFGGPRPGGPPVGGGMSMMRPPEKAKDFSGTLRRLLSYLKPYRLRLVLVFLFAILGTVFSIIAPKLIGNITTILFQGMVEMQKGDKAYWDMSGIGRILMILLGLYVFSSLFMYLQQFLLAGMSQKIVYRLRQRLSSKLERLPMERFDRHPHGDLLSRMVNDLDNVATTFQQSLVQMVVALTSLLGMLAMMLWISPTLTLVALITLPLSFFAIRQIAPRAQSFFVSQQRALGLLNASIEESFSGLAVVRAFGLEKQREEAFSEQNEALYQSGFRAQFISGLIWPVMTLVTNLGYVMIAVVGALFVASGRLLIGDVQAFIQYARQFNQPITQTANIANVIQSTIASAERVFEFLDFPEEVPDERVAPPFVRVRGEVVFDQVSFRYEADRPLIENLSFVAQPGERVAIVGPTGAGKTTLVNLLMRFYDVASGRILLDRIDLRAYPRDFLRRQFAMVLQDTWLFEGTIRENIAYGQPEATIDAVVAAAKAARAHDFIQTLPNGYETKMDEEGMRLSSGERQLLTIARALLVDPPMLILDEATSSVDTRTERKVQEALEHLMEGRTSFIIAHRLSTIESADIILVMNEGKIVEQGTHPELLEKNGFYASLYWSQFQSETVEAS